LNTVPAGLVAGIERRLQAVGAGDRVDEVLDELHRVRADAGSPPPASPVGRILASQAIQHVLTARRWEMVDEEMRRLLVGEYGHPPAPVDPAARAVAERTAAQTEPQTSLEDAKAEAGPLAASEEDLCLVALFGESAFPLLSTLRGRRMPTGDEAAVVDDSEGERIRRLMRMLDESGLHEITVDDGGVRYTLKKPEPAPPVQYVATAPVAVPTNGPTPPAEAAPPAEDLILIESPMVATFYRAPSPSQPAFVEEGDRVEVGQTLCVLEAMKLFNELKAEHAGTVRKILVGNAEPVEFGQTLFEIAPTA
jgi:oxaloacetate decarboxylase alpha subunit